MGAGAGRTLNSPVPLRVRVHALLHPDHDLSVNWGITRVLSDPSSRGWLFTCHTCGKCWAY